MIVVSGVALLTFGAGVADADADTVAVNGGATYVSSTSEMLNGLANVQNPDSSVQFEYATSQDFSSPPQWTTVVPIGPGTTAVSTTVTDLTPGQNYYFRLLVLQGSDTPQMSVSDTLAFTAGSNQPTGGGSGTVAGTASLATAKLKVTKGMVAIPIDCKGASSAVCTGETSITARGRLPHNTKESTVRCGGGSFSATTGNAAVVHGKLSKGCETLLGRARQHTLHATLRATFTSKQNALTKSVTLTG